MRRLDVGIFFPSLKRPFGGERLIVETADHLAEHADVTLYTAAARPEASPKRAKLVALRLDWSRHAAQTIGDWAAAPLIARKAGQHDVLLAMNYQGVLAGALAARRLRVPLVYHCTEPPRFLYDLKDLQTRRVPGVSLAEAAARKLDRWAVAQATSIISISDWTAAQVKQVYGRESTVIYPGIETQSLLDVNRQTAREEFGIHDTERLYLSLSKLHPRKQLTKAIDLFRERERENGKARLVIVGEGPDRARLEAHARAVGETRVQFTGFVEEAARVRWLRAADIFVFTARDEPFGLAPLEAKAAGALVIPAAPGFPIRSPRESTAEVAKVLNNAVGGLL